MSNLLPETQKRIKELEQQKQSQIEENQRQNAIARQQRQFEEQEAKTTVLAKREAERLRVEENQKSEMKRVFMSANPSANVEDFERLYPTIRDDYLKNEAKREQERQLASARQYYDLL